LLVSAANAEGSAGLFLTDDILSLRLNERLYTSSLRNLDDELNRMLENNGMDLRVPYNLNLSYSALKRFFMGGSISAIAPEFAQANNKYTGLIKTALSKSLITNGEAEKVSIGDKEVNCKTIVIDISGENLRGIAEQLLASKGSLDKKPTIIARSLGKIKNITDYLDVKDYRVTCVCYENRIIALRVAKEDNQTLFTASTTGDPYRLNEISVALYDDSFFKRMKEPNIESESIGFYSLEAVGNHIDGAVFNSQVSIYGPESASSGLMEYSEYLLSWVPDKDADNFTLTDMYSDSSIYTLAQDPSKSGVFFRSPNLDYSLQPMTTRPEWPDNAASLSDLEFFR
jgi:hypothetical protein